MEKKADTLFDKGDIVSALQDLEDKREADRGR